MTRTSFLLAVAILCAGCGNSEPKFESVAQNQSLEAPVERADSSNPVVISTIESEEGLGKVVLASAELPPEPEQNLADVNETEDTSPVEIEELDKGSPEWLLREMTRLRTAPLDKVRKVDPKTKAAEVITLSPQQAEQERLRRQHEIIELAQQAIGKTHQNPAAEKLFNNAVHYLAEARAQLALAGDRQQADLMSEDADALFKRDSSSFAAIEAAHELVELTQQQAMQHGQQDSKWVLAFARQSRLFAEKFPQDSSRTGILLLQAGRMCDQFRLTEEALKCLSTLKQLYPESPFAQQSVPIQRRLELTGQQLTEFGGSTHDGGFLSIDQLQGKAVLIAFWASNSQSFRSALPRIEKVLAQHPGKVIAVGVNLDRDEIAVDQFLEQTGNAWKHVFFSDLEKRGAGNLVARHYGVSRVPMYWLVGSDGKVKSVDLNLDDLEQAVQQAIQ